MSPSSDENMGNRVSRVTYGKKILNVFLWAEERNSKFAKHRRWRQGPVSVKMSLALSMPINITWCLFHKI